MRSVLLVSALVLGVMLVQGCKTDGSETTVSAVTDPTYKSKISKISEPLLECQDGSRSFLISEKNEMIWRRDFAGSADGWQASSWFVRTGSYADQPNIPYEFRATGAVYTGRISEAEEYHFRTINTNGVVTLEIKDDFDDQEAVMFACKILGPDVLPSPPKGDYLCMGPGEASFYASGFLIDVADSKIHDVTVNRQGGERRYFPLETLALKKEGNVIVARAMGGFMGEPRGFVFKLTPAGAPGEGTVVIADAILDEESESGFRNGGGLGSTGSRTFDCIAP